MGQSRPLFVLFLPFSHSNINFNIINRKNRRWCARESNPGRWMIGADETTALWSLPLPFNFFNIKSNFEDEWQWAQCLIGQNINIF